MLQPPIPERACIAHLEKCGYVLRPGSDLGAPGMIRITIGTPEQIEGLIAALETIRDGAR